MIDNRAPLQPQDPPVAGTRAAAIDSRICGRPVTGLRFPSGRWRRLLLAALTCCTPAALPAGSGGGNVVGAWLMMADGVEFPGGCFSDLPIQYHPDGTYSAWGEGGTWRLKRAQLVEIAASADPMLVEESAVEIGKAHVSDLRWAGPDGFWKWDGHGRVREFRRCPRSR